MSLKDQMRKDFETVFLNTDEFAETFAVIRNGVMSHKVDGIFANKTLLQVKLDADVLPGDILKSQETSRQITVQNTSRDFSCLNVHCR
ncbi:hypothetical protein [Sporomusa sp.]|uniref:hypothetical protein n=1 Tax=Sporomusa sp. TaxID=2078658 RepID=UPI002C2AECE3|nr:hypothetical protein [Sporomusa sp.]HWR07783.1 hypothetical protein [Sporomusa sp.]